MTIYDISHQIGHQIMTTPLGHNPPTSRDCARYVEETQLSLPLFSTWPPAGGGGRA